MFALLEDQRGYDRDDACGSRPGPPGCRDNIAIASAAGACTSIALRLGFIAFDAPNPIAAQSLVKGYEGEERAYLHVMQPVLTLGIPLRSFLGCLEDVPSLLSYVLGEGLEGEIDGCSVRDLRIGMIWTLSADNIVRNEIPVPDVADHRYKRSKALRLRRRMSW